MLARVDVDLKPRAARDGWVEATVTRGCVCITLMCGCASRVTRVSTVGSYPSDGERSMRRRRGHHRCALQHTTSTTRPPPRPVPRTRATRCSTQSTPRHTKQHTRPASSLTCGPSRIKYDLSSTRSARRVGSAVPSRVPWSAGGGGGGGRRGDEREGALFPWLSSRERGARTAHGGSAARRQFGARVRVTASNPHRVARASARASEGRVILPRTRR